jgi:hypothetical protein
VSIGGECPRCSNPEETKSNVWVCGADYDPVVLIRLAD